MLDIDGTQATLLVSTVFLVTYAGMALGRLPGLRIDRAGIALIAAIVLLGAGATSRERVVAAIDFPTLFILFGLMILSALFATSGFYDWCSHRIASARRSPAALLAITVVTAGLLSAVLANDVVVFAMTPLLCVGLRDRGLDPRPYLIALAGAANAGSAATVIGNPQNILIGQSGGLDFWTFTANCAVPAGLGLACVYGVVRTVWRESLRPGPQAKTLAPATAAPRLDRWYLTKAVVATAALLALFATPLPHETGVLVIAGAVLISRRLATRSMLVMVDWPLLVLFAALFVVTDAWSATGVPADAVALLAAAGIAPDSLAVMAPLALLGSNSVGNVPMVMVLLSVWPDLPEGTLYGLAVLSTLAGNLLLVGSLANLIVAERAREVGVVLGFRDHARCGIPMTLLSFACAIAWLAVTGAMAMV